MKPCNALRFLVGLLILCGSASSENYDWPLEAPPALTSTYAEYRSGRFHAGLDVKTWGKEGFACVAVADGYVWRVRTSPWGYGRAVYIRLQDGRTAVYAHLSEFVERIEKVVAEEHASFQMTVDFISLLEGPNSVIGKAVVVEAEEDDFDPSRGDGVSLACGVIQM